MTATQHLDGLLEPTDRVRIEFNRHFGNLAESIIRAPGRVNLIGEHTDYNDGFVLPMAIDRWTCLALRRREDRSVRLHSLEFDETQTFSLDGLVPDAAHGWAAYPHGVAGALVEADFQLTGFDGVIASTVPIGAGLSSSASVELAVARAFAVVSGFDWDAPRLARICQRAENHWVGVNCGIMDQLISASGLAGHAVLMDCRDLSLRYVPLPSSISIVILDTGKRRGLVDSAYNERRSQCAAAAKACGAKALRDVTESGLDATAHLLDEDTFRRARHVITENRRTQEAAEAMAGGDTVRMGTLMNESHRSLRDDFEVSCCELDIMVDIAQRQKGCLGARMTGAGFGGSAIALVRTTAIEDFLSGVAPAYRQATGLTPAVYVSRPSNGAEVMEGMAR
jgi:galactokinase